ncbi:MAG: beta galactosidase jelly roll domain-containing protein [Candidatus Azobacteroides sp.]|nr:beta galactosidase jelly roll domain-containing protein [Candidatus Azobacteroides sp.]
MNKKKLSLISMLLLIILQIPAKEIPLVSSIYQRSYISLNGKWNYVIDPLENGYYDYRLQPFKTAGFFENKKAQDPSDLVEYNLDTSPLMNVPSDWNSQDEQLFFYEGTVWFKKDFPIEKKTGTRYVLYFGAVNYDAKVYVNGKKVGEHIGGYTPFNFDITEVIHDGDNFVVVKVDNKRHKDNVPTVNMDWWNYGGITREVMIAVLPETYIEDYSFQLKDGNTDQLTGWIKLNYPIAGQTVSVEIPELKVKQQLRTDENGKAWFGCKAKPVLWTPEHPKLYEFRLSKENEKITDEIGFRTICTEGKKILLNGKHVFLRGISIHEEAPFRSGRAWSREDAVTLLTWAKELGCNYVRLAHYPHHETMVREAEKMGLMVWSEIPVYWTISWENPATYKNAENQLHDMIYRDKNRCAIVIWSIANETPHSEARDRFLSNLSAYACNMDNTRLISMAMETTRNPETKTIHMEDSMNEYVDIISFNQYMGWYWGNMTEWANANWNIPYDKPVIVSEFGGGALQGLHGDSNRKFTEEYQEELYKYNLQMFDRISGLSGLSPWVLVDFRSPRRQLPGIQDFFNRKGLISDSGNKKKAFYIMKSYYEEKVKDKR